MGRRWVAAVAAIMVLPLAACTGEDPPPPSASKAPPSQTPTPSKGPSTPSMREQEHQDLLEVQDVYKRAFAEQQRLLAEGGANKLPASLEELVSGTYRQTTLKSMRIIRSQGVKMTKPGRILGVSMGPWSVDKVTFYGCEDLSTAEWVDKNGNKEERDPRTLRVEQRFVARKHGGQWTLDDIDSKVLKNFDSSRCNGVWYS